jgi:hypothetical protein
MKGKKHDVDNDEDKKLRRKYYMKEDRRMTDSDVEGAE